MAYRTLYGAINAGMEHRTVTVAKRLTQLEFKDFVEVFRHGCIAPSTIGLARFA
jgi:hypothetical protein